MNKTMKTGLIAALSAYLLWGGLPMYWKFLGVVPPLELLAWRVVGCGFYSWIFFIARGKRALKPIFTPKVIGPLVLASVLIGFNWGIYIWAVSAERILEASLGYYINPLVNVVLGVIFFSETLGRKRLAAVGLALAGVILMALDTGTFPWLSLLLALLFGFYSLLVKRLPAEIDSIEVLAWQTAFLSPIAVAYLVTRFVQGEAHFVGFGTDVTFLLILSGVVTLAPLWLFGVAVKRIPLGSLGILQYVAPTIMLLLGVLVYGEPFGLFRGAAFVLVAMALVIYSSTIVDY